MNHARDFIGKVKMRKKINSATFVLLFIFVVVVVDAAPNPEQSTSELEKELRAKVDDLEKKLAAARARAADDAESGDSKTEDDKEEDSKEKEWEMGLHEWALALLIFCLLLAVGVSACLCIGSKCCRGDSGGNENAVFSFSDVDNINASNAYRAGRKGGGGKSAKSAEFNGVVIGGRKSANPSGNRKAGAVISAGGGANVSRSSMNRQKSMRSSDDRGEYKTLPLIGKRTDDSAESETGN